VRDDLKKIARTNKALAATLRPGKCLTNVPYTLHLSPYALYPIPDTLRPMPYALYPIPYALCPLPYTRYPTPHAL